jgi:dihydroxy-acid dehydratase
LEKWRSKKVWQSPDAAGGRTTFKSVGLTDEDFKRPIIGIANTWAETGPGHMHLRQVAEVVKAGVWQAGGVPLEFGNMAQCPNHVEGSHGIRYDTATRDILSFSIEACTELHMFDGLVMIGTCDKIIPGFLLAAARLDLPTVIVPGGSMKPGNFRGKAIMSDLLMTESYAYSMGKSDLSLEELTEMEDCICPSAGACAVLGTANTVQCMAEAIGLTLPGGGTAPAVSSKRLWIAKNSGRKIMDLIRDGISARDILTEKSILNAIMVLHALGGSTNTILHILALVHELNLDDKIDLRTIEALGEKIPCITAIQPSGPYTVGDLDDAGGIQGVMKQLEAHLDLDVMTVTGKNLSENLKTAKVKNEDMIHPLDHPVYKGGLAVLSGNLAKSAIARPTIIGEDMLRHKGPAKVFNSMEEADEGIRRGLVKEGDVVVARYEGPRGGPGTTDMLSVVLNLHASGLYKTCCMITDGKVSGFGRAPYICQVSPEAYIGGPLAIVEDGDMIEYDMKDKSMNLLISDDEIKKRLAKWTPPAPRVHDGFLSLYVKLGNPVELGAGLDLKL